MGRLFSRVCQQEGKEKHEQCDSRGGTCRSGKCGIIYANHRNGTFSGRKELQNPDFPVFGCLDPVSWNYLPQFQTNNFFKKSMLWFYRVIL